MTLKVPGRESCLVRERSNDPVSRQRSCKHGAARRAPSESVQEDIEDHSDESVGFWRTLPLYVNPGSYPVTTGPPDTQLVFP